MSVRCDVNRVDVEVVEPGARLRLDLRLCDSDMVEAVPFPEEATARQRQLLDDPADDAAARASADRSQVPRPHLVARHERGVPRRYHELVQVTVEPARGGEARDLAVGGVDDNPLPNAEPLSGREARVDCTPLEGGGPPFGSEVGSPRCLVPLTGVPLWQPWKGIPG